MKRILIAMLMLLLCMTLIVSCGEKKDDGTKPDATPGTVESPTETQEENDPLGKIVSLPYGGCTITNLGTDTKIGISADGKSVVADGTGNSLLTLYPVDGWQNTKSHYICFGDEAEVRMALDNPLPKKEPKISYRRNNRPEQFIFHEQKDGSYIIRTGYSAETVLACVDGKIVNQLYDANSKNQYWKVDRVDYPQTNYAEWVSEKGNIFLRLPTDILQTASTTDERMQGFADDIQKIYDAYIELTDYTPYPAIIVKGQEKQGVMAGVVDGCNTIFINVEWYVDDIAKLQKRWEAGKRDFNFCILHEMGHQFDSGRGWNFESEMEADLKAVYVLYKHRADDKYGAYAAPAEFGASECFDHMTITQAYDRLGRNMEVEYSFYGAAKVFTELAHETGWEAVKKMFHRFQAERLLASDLTPNERMTKFINYWNDNTDVDVISFLGPKVMKVLTDKFPPS